MPERFRHPAAVASLRPLAIFTLIALIVLTLAWELWLAPLRPGGSWLAIKTVPLFLPLPGILAGRRSTYLWSSLLILLYLLEGALRAISDPGTSRWFALGEAVLAGAFLFAAMFYARLGKPPRVTTAD